MSVTQPPEVIIIDPNQIGQQVAYQMNQQTAQQQGTQQGPKTTLTQLVQQCDQTRQQLSQQLATLPNPTAQFAVQMAMNALDSCSQQCTVAANAVMQAGLTQ